MISQSLESLATASVSEPIMPDTGVSTRKDSLDRMEEMAENDAIMRL
jgi:hypothetical protein